MATRIVDVFLQDGLVASYVLTLKVVHDPMLEQDLINAAKERMTADDFTAEQIAAARFSIRS
jgi:hypothetical protein